MRATIVGEMELTPRKREILRREKQYDAVVKKKADAERYAVEQSAEAEKLRRIEKGREGKEKTKI